MPWMFCDLMKKGFWHKGRKTMTTVVRNRAITDTPSANKRVALTSFTSHPLFEDFTNSHRCANHVYGYNSFFSRKTFK